MKGRDIFMNEEKKKNNNNNKEKKESDKVKTSNSTIKNKNQNVTNDKKVSKNVQNKTNRNNSKKNVKEAKVIEKEVIVENAEKEEQETTVIIKKKEESKPKESKIGLIIILTILLVIVGICLYYQVDNKNSNVKVDMEESNELVDEFYKYYNSKKIKVIYYASSTCGYCSLETPIMEQISKDYSIDYLHIDSNKLSSSDKNKILKELNIEHATPTTVVVKDGEVLGTQIGYVDGGAMVEFLIEQKVLEKDATYSPERYLTFINYDEYNKLLLDSEKNIVTIGQTGCSHCTATKPVLNQIAKEYNIEINYLNITDMSQKEVNSFTNSLKEIGYDDKDFLEKGSFGTPLTLIIENGKVISYVIGERPTVEFVRAFKKSGVITE